MAKLLKGRYELAEDQIHQRKCRTGYDSSGKGNRVEDPGISVSIIEYAFVALEPRRLCLLIQLDVRHGG